MPSCLDGGILTIFALKLSFLLLRLAIHSRVFLHQPISPVVLTSLHNVEVFAFCTYLLNLMFFESSQFVVYNLTQVWTFCLRPAFATRTSLITTREVISFQRRASEDSGGGDRPDHLFPPEVAVGLCSEGHLSRNVSTSGRIFGRALVGHTTMGTLSGL